MYNKMFEKYNLEGDDFRKIMIIQKKEISSSFNEKVHKVILAWFTEESDAPYEYSVTHMLNEKSFGNGRYFSTKFDENALKHAMEAFYDIDF